MVPRVLKPASSAFLAQSTSVLPSVPGTVLGRPIPMSTHYLRWRRRRMDLSPIQARRAGLGAGGGPAADRQLREPGGRVEVDAGRGGGPAGRRQYRAARDPGQLMVVDRNGG